MNELIKVNYENDRPTVLARDLHEFLEVQTPYHKWFPRMCEYGFSENIDYMMMDKNVLRSDGTKMPQVQHDAQLTIEMAKQTGAAVFHSAGKGLEQPGVGDGKSAEDGEQPNRQLGGTHHSSGTED